MQKKRSVFGRSLEKSRESAVVFGEKSFRQGLLDW